MLQSFTGIISYIYVLLWCYNVYNTPARHPRITAEEKTYIQTAIGPSAYAKVSFRMPPHFSKGCCYISLAIPIVNRDFQLEHFYMKIATSDWNRDLLIPWY